MRGSSDNRDINTDTRSHVEDTNKGLSAQLDWNLGDAIQRVPRIDSHHIALHRDDNGYIKRMVTGPLVHMTALVATNGDVIMVDGRGEERKRDQVAGVIRDATWSNENPWLFVCTEAGWVIKIDVVTNDVCPVFQSPRARSSDRVWMVTALVAADLAAAGAGTLAAGFWLAASSFPCK